MWMMFDTTHSEEPFFRKIVRKRLIGNYESIECCFPRRRNSRRLGEMYGFYDNFWMTRPFEKVIYLIHIATQCKL